MLIAVTLSLCLIGDTSLLSVAAEASGGGGVGKLQISFFTDMLIAIRHACVYRYSTGAACRYLEVIVAVVSLYADGDHHLESPGRLSGEGRSPVAQRSGASDGSSTAEIGSAHSSVRLIGRWTEPAANSNAGSFAVERMAKSAR